MTSFCCERELPEKCRENLVTSFCCERELPEKCKNDKFKIYSPEVRIGKSRFL